MHRNNCLKLSTNLLNGKYFLASYEVILFFTSQNSKTKIFALYYSLTRGVIDVTTQDYRHNPERQIRKIPLQMPSTDAIQEIS